VSKRGRGNGEGGNRPGPRSPGGGGEDPGSAAPRKRPPRRRLLWISLSLPLALLGLLILFRNPLLRLLAPAVLGHSLGLDLEIEHLSLALDGDLEVRGLTGRNPRDWASIRSLSIPEMEIKASPLGLLTRGLAGVRRIKVSGGSAELELDRSPAGVEPGKREKRKGSGWPATLPPAEISLDRLDIRSGESRLVLENAALESLAETAGSSLRLRTLFDWNLAGSRGKDSLAVSFHYQNGEVSNLAAAFHGETFIEEGWVDLARLALRAKLHPGGGDGSISVDRAESGEVESRLTLEEVALERLPGFGLVPESQRPRGKLSLDGEAALPPADPLAGRARLSLSLREASVGELAIPKVDLEVGLGDRVLTIPSLEAAAEGLEIEGKEMALSLQSPEFEKVLSSLSGALSLSSADLGKALKPLEGLPALAEGSLPQLLFSQAELKGSLRARGGVLSLQGLELVSPLFALTVEKGSLVPDPRSLLASRLALEGRFESEDLWRLSQLFPGLDTSLEGALDVRFSAAGPLDSPSMSLSVAGSDLSGFGVALGGLKGELTASPEAIQVRSLVLASSAGPPLKLSFKGGLRLQEKSLRAVRLSLETSGLRTRLASLKFARWLPPGPVRILARAEGPLAWPELEVSGSAPRAGLAAGGEEGSFSFALRDGGLELSAEGLAVQDFTISARAEGRLEPGAASGDLLLGSLAIVRGKERWAGEGKGRLKFSRGERLLLIDPPIVLSGADGGRLLLSVAPAATEQGGGLEARLDAAFPGPLPFGLRAGGAQVSGLQATVRARWPELALPPGLLPRRLDLQAGAGQVAGPRFRTGFKAAINLDRSGPRPKAEASLEIPDLTVQPPPDAVSPGPPVTGKLAFRAGWDGEELRVAALEGRLATLHLTGGGSAELRLDLDSLLEGKAGALAPPGRLDLRLLAEAEDLSPVRELVPDLRWLRGKARLETRVAGSGTQPDLSAALTLSQVEARYGEVPPLSALNGTISLAARDLTADLKGELGSAPLTIRGKVVSLFSSPRGELAVKGENILLARNDNARLRADTNLTLSGEGDRLLLGGSIQITDGRVLKEMPLLDLGALMRRVGSIGRGTSASMAAPRASSLSLFSLRQPPFRDLKLEVAISEKSPIEVRSNLFRGKVRPDLKLLGTGLTPYLEGSIYLDDWVIMLPVTRIRLESGLVRFDPANPLFPELNLIGTTRMQGYDITMTVSGRFNDPNVVFSSSPPLPSDQLMLLVTTGRPPAADRGETTELALLTVAKTLGADLIRNLFGGEDLESSESILDRFEIEVGRDVSKAGQQTLEVRFRLKRSLLWRRDNLFLTGERDEFEHYNVGLRLVIRGR
jgi:hypothetical protein